MRTEHTPQIAGYRRHAKILGATLVGMVLVLTVAILLVRERDRSTTRALLGLGERIREAYGLPTSPYGYPIHFVGEILRSGMSESEVDSTLRRIRPEIVRVEWFVVRDTTGPVGVLQGVILGTAGKELANVDVYYKNGVVWNVDNGRYGTLVPVTADSARSLLTATRGRGAA